MELNRKIETNKLVMNNKKKCESMKHTRESRQNERHRKSHMMCETETYGSIYLIDVSKECKQIWKFL